MACGSRRERGIMALRRAIERLQFEQDGLPFALLLCEVGASASHVLYFEVDVAESEELTPTRTLRLTDDFHSLPIQFNFAENNDGCSLSQGKVGLECKFDVISEWQVVCVRLS